jgi:hypothetical protein
MFTLVGRALHFRPASRSRPAPTARLPPLPRAHARPDRGHRMAAARGRRRTGGMPWAPPPLASPKPTAQCPALPLLLILPRLRSRAAAAHHRSIAAAKLASAGVGRYCCPTAAKLL